LCIRMSSSLEFFFYSCLNCLLFGILVGYDCHLSGLLSFIGVACLFVLFKFKTFFKNQNFSMSLDIIPSFIFSHYTLPLIMHNYDYIKKFLLINIYSTTTFFWKREKSMYTALICSCKFTWGMGWHKRCAS
jgi:hypothetical protein